MSQTKELVGFIRSLKGSVSQKRLSRKECGFGVRKSLSVVSGSVINIPSDQE